MDFRIMPTFLKQTNDTIAKVKVAVKGHNEYSFEFDNSLIFVKFGEGDTAHF